MQTWRKQTRKPDRTELDRFSELLPVGELTAAGFDKLVQAAGVSDVPAHQYLFRAGGNDALSIFLLRGQVELETDDKRLVVKAGTETARYALANLKPRRFSGRTVTDVCIMHVESDVLDKLVTWDQVSRGATTGLHVEELDGGEDPEWFREMLGNPIFMRIPTANIEELVTRFEPVPAKAGDTVMAQGDPGHDYFIIRRGRCEVLRHSGSGAQAVRIAERHPGEGLGEEALLSDKPRDATVRMLTDGLLMKLNRRDFEHLVKEPLLDWIDEEQVIPRIREQAVLIDVRLENEFEHGTLKGAVNIPLYLLRLKIDGLDRNRQHIVFCDTGARSATAAFILGTRGYTASAIRGGINACRRLLTTARTGS